MSPLPWILSILFFTGVTGKPFPERSYQFEFHKNSLVGGWDESSTSSDFVLPFRIAQDVLELKWKEGLGPSGHVVKSELLTLKLAPEPINITSGAIGTFWTPDIIEQVLPASLTSWDEGSVSGQGLSPGLSHQGSEHWQSWSFHNDPVPQASLSKPLNLLSPSDDLFQLIQTLEEETQFLSTDTSNTLIQSQDIVETTEVTPPPPPGPDVESDEQLVGSPTTDTPPIQIKVITPTTQRPISSPVNRPPAPASASNGLGPSINVLSQITGSVAALSAVSAVYGAAATLPIWLPIVLGRRKKRNAPLSYSIGQTNKGRDQDKIVNQIKGLLNGIADDTKSNDTRGSGENKDDADDILATPINDSVLLPVEKTALGDGRQEPKSTTKQTSSKETEKPQASQISTTTISTTTATSTTTTSTNTATSTITTKVTVTTKIPTTTTQSTTTTRRQTPATTPRTTTTTQLPVTFSPVTTSAPPPGMLARIGNFMSGSMSNFGQTLVTGTSILAAAAAPLLVQMAVGKRKRRNLEYEKEYKEDMLEQAQTMMNAAKRNNYN